MAKAKPILYGVSDFVRTRMEGAYYIDRTAYIRELEKTSYVMFQGGDSVLCEAVLARGLAVAGRYGSRSCRSPRQAGAKKVRLGKNNVY